METRDNPYRAPTCVNDALCFPATRVVSNRFVALVGMVAGAFSFRLAIHVIPTATLERHGRDLPFVISLIIFALCVGVFIAWIRQTASLLMLGLVPSVVIAVLFYCFPGYNFAAYRLFLPCVLGVTISMILGAKHSDWTRGIGLRIAAGVLLGIVFALVYTAVLNVVDCLVIIGIWKPFSGRSGHSWWAGTPAMISASAIYFLVLVSSIRVADSSQKAGELTVTPKSANGCF